MDLVSESSTLGPAMKHYSSFAFIPMTNTLPPYWVLFLLLLISLPIAAQKPSPPPIIEINRIVAVVNDEVIVHSDLKNRVRTMQAELSRSGARLPPPDVLRKQVLDRLIVELLQIQMAKRTGIRVNDEQLNQTIAGIARRNGLDLRRFREILEKDGYSFATFREDIRHQLLISEIQKRKVADRVQVTNREIDNYLMTESTKPRSKRNYHLAHILIAVSEDASVDEVASARKKAEQTVRRLRDGADFAKTAMTVSDGNQASEGGDLGWRKETQLPGLFAKVVPEMATGEVSEPLRNASGFHIVKLVALRGEERHVVTQTKARHILVRPSETVSNIDAKTRLEQIRERIIHGEDFGELARSHSDDRGTAVKGGDIGWVGPGSVVPKFEQAMNRLRPMEISAPFRSQFGWHIVQVMERRKHDGTMEVRRAKAMERIRKRKIDEELRAWLRQLRDEAYVEYRLEE
uniref:Chaperone SurA n=1 Tax=Candidatus Kentrum sp. FW TaxID=2126338 RepID=A0A450SQB7_9GAMM|nr:MAG: periplasmic chaperone for outer membrane proteins SurA [Candidatus Kentron sp. FW]VFJ56133.1 MAG: periplasmic chaperone for outer membrane proteins SurA [Candidatus Kentron sp. FW]